MQEETREIVHGYTFPLRAVCYDCLFETQDMNYPELVKLIESLGGKLCLDGGGLETICPRCKTRSTLILD